VTGTTRVIAIVIAVAVLFGAGGYYVAKKTTATTTTTSSSTTTSSVATTSSTVASTSCVGASFTGVLQPSQGAAGSIYTSVLMTYHGSSTCTTTGWPLIRYFNASGSPMTTTIVRSSSFFTGQAGVPTTPAPVTVQSGGSLQFSLGYSDVPVGTQTSCPTVDHFTVNLPGSLGTSNAITVSGGGSFAPCGAGLAYVSPLYA